MRKINTKLGEIYIEEIGSRAEKDRVKIYDSDDKYLEYWGVDTIEDYANNLGVSSEEWMELWITGCEITNDIRILLDTLAIDYSLLVEGSVSALNVAFKADLVCSMSELQDHELVNRIGNFYIFHRDADMGQFDRKERTNGAYQNHK